MLNFFFWFIFNFFKNVYFLVCIILLKALNFFFLIRLGALTSKPFAYKAWSWELSSSYIADITNINLTKLRVDSKGLEIVRILPWLNNNLSEEWITDKARFFYDGLSLNRITKFFLKKKFILLPIIILILHLTDPLFSKYCLNFNNLSNILKNLYFKNSKQNVFFLFFFFYKFFNLYKNLFFNDNVSINFSNEVLFHDKGWVNRICLLGDFKFFRNQQNLFYNKFCWLRKNLSQNFSHFVSILPNKFNSTIIFNLFNFKNSFKFSFFLNDDIDMLNLSFLRTINNTNLNYFFPFKSNWNFLILKNKFQFKLDYFLLSKINVIFLINSNLWITNPKLHIQIRWLLKSTDISVISIGNTDELLFKNWSFGNYINFFKNFLNGKHWLTSYFIKKITALFILNFQTENFKIYNFKIFMSRVIKKNFQTENFKNYSFPVIYYYYTSSIPLLNQFVYLSFFNYWKFSMYNKINLKKNKFFSNLFIFTTNYNVFINNFLKLNFKLLNKNYFILLESNLINWTENLNWDIILPVSTITENYFQFKSIKTTIVKSLFIKFGPWYSWNLFTYLNYFFLIMQFPYFWLNNLLKFFNYVNVLYLIFWIKAITFNSISIITNKYKIYKIFVYNSSDLKNKIIQKFGFFNFINWNFWSSNLSYINNSKYINMAKNLLIKDSKTFFN